MKVTYSRRSFPTPVRPSPMTARVRTLRSESLPESESKPKRPMTRSERIDVALKFAGGGGLIGALIWAPWPIAVGTFIAAVGVLAFARQGDDDALSRMTVPEKLRPVHRPRMGIFTAVQMAGCLTAIVVPWVYLSWYVAAPVMIAAVLTFGFFVTRAERQGEAGMHYFNVYRSAIDLILKERREIIMKKTGGAALLAETDAMMAVAPHLVNRFSSFGPAYARRVMAIYEAQRDELERLSTRRSVGNARDLIDEVR